VDNVSVALYGNLLYLAVSLLAYTTYFSSFSPAHESTKSTPPSKGRMRFSPILRTSGSPRIMGTQDQADVEGQSWYVTRDQRGRRYARRELLCL
jgi:hypothetical protein